MAKRSIDKLTVGGLIFGVFLLLASVLSKGENPLMFWDVGSAIMVIGGSIAAIMVATPKAHLAQAKK